MSDAQTLDLGDSLDMTAAGPLAAGFLERRGQPIAVDASQVRRIGGQCLQVLLSARATWLADGQGFQVVNPSPEFAEGVALMGAADLADLSFTEEEIL
jgi:chemotaxis protein CheX